MFFEIINFIISTNLRKFENVKWKLCNFVHFLSKIYPKRGKNYESVLQVKNFRIFCNEKEPENMLNE